MAGFVKKIQKLKEILYSYPGVVVAFSGGVDSTLLLRLAKDVLKEKVIAVTAASPLYPDSEKKHAEKIAAMLKIKHIIINSDEMENPDFIKNPRNRCFYCKIELFKKLKGIAKKYGYVVLEGSNYSDLNDFRPGLVAAKKMNIKSPLIEARLTKAEIRELARELRLPNWNRPSMACLASRIPYGKKIDKIILKRIERGEAFLRILNFSQCRVRDYFPIARIEISENEFKKIIIYKKKIVKYFKRLGYKYITIDLEGYRTGSMNQ
ncbi:MAG: ATP-dependent sacrificial sulfur transferase LarE [bacterium]